ncbi:hypothetical protein BH11MYX1_BH11MYX1_06900 [soil metagenome]
MKRRSCISVAFLVLALAACEKDGAAPKGSGELGAEDKALFAVLPSGATAVFGGNYLKLQDFMSSTLGKTTTTMMEKYGPGMAEWTKCFVEIQTSSGIKHKLRIAGAANVTGSNGLDLRMVWSGMTLDDVTTCAQKGNFKVTLDDDKKFLTVELPPPSGTQGYLLTSAGTLYVRQSMIISAAPVITPSTRSELETDLAASSKANVLSDQKMMALITKTDRTKTVWFAGSGAGTRAADKVGEVFGSFDLNNGIAVDVTAQVLDDAMLGKLEDGVAELKKMSGQLPGNMKEIVSQLQFSRKSDHARFSIKVDDKQLADLIKQAGMFGVH